MSLGLPPRSLRRLGAVAALLGAALGARRAEAAPERPRAGREAPVNELSCEPATIEPLFAEARRLRETRRDVEALAIYRRVHEACRDARSLAQIGLAEQALGRWVDAEVHLGSALAIDHPWIVQYRATLESALEVVRGRLTSLELRSRPPGASVKLDGRRIGVTPLGPIRVPLGELALELEAPGHHPEQRTISAVERRPIVLELALVPLPGPATQALGLDAGRARPQPDVTPPGRSGEGPASSAREAPAPWLAIAVGGAAVAALVAGTAFGLAAKSSAEDQDLSTDATGAALGANLSFGTGIVLGAAAAVLYAVGPTGGDGE